MPISWQTENERRAQFTYTRSFATASKLDLVDVKVRNVTTDTNLIEQYLIVFKGIGKLRNYEVKLHIDDTVQPVAQNSISLGSC